MQKEILQALRNNRNWFLNSGVLAADGKWGVAERVFLTGGNEAVELTLDSFPSWSRIPEGYIIEQRRADCAFQCAWYFLQLSKIFETENNRALAENLLDFLYCRSGLLSHHKIDEPYPVGCWNWSHIRWTPSVYYDDNAWAIIIALAIAATCPEWDEKYQMKQYALAGAQALYCAFASNFPQDQADYVPHWNGNLQLPHWGALACAALGRAAEYASAEEKDKYYALIRKYMQFVEDKANEWNCSELCYSLLSISMMSSLPMFSEYLLPLGCRLADIICQAMDENCLLPSEHYEAPAGGQLADLIYTMNFAAVAFTGFTPLVPNQKQIQNVRYKIREFLLKIQDKHPSLHLNGCWRGMYNVSMHKWGGGNHTEGGADSIYTGWTNAPIGWALAGFFLQEKLI